MRRTPKSLTFLATITGLCFLSSCGIKNFPKETPFVYQNKIELNNPSLKKEELATLKGRLTTQLADSMRTRVKETAVFFKRLINPPAFSPEAASQSADNMEIFLKTIGYYNGWVTYQTSIDTIRKEKKEDWQYRAITTFKVQTGPVFRVADIDYFIGDSTLRSLSCNSRSNSTLQPGVPFTEELMITEIDRLIELYRNNGYYKISREQLYVDVDTVYLPLLNPLLDPFERIAVLQEAQRRREKPTINVYIRNRPNVDSGAYAVYKIGKLRVFPDFAGNPVDSSAYKSYEVPPLTILERSRRYKHSFIRSHIDLQPGALFRSRDLNRTLTDLNGLNAWQFIKVEPKEQPLSQLQKGDTPRIDFDFLLSPARKYSFTADLESVFNQVQQTLVGTAGNLIGIGVNLGIRNRNFRHQGIQSTNTLRFAVESGIGSFNSGLQAFEIAYNNSFSMPKILWLDRVLARNALQRRTFLSNNVSFINRNIGNRGLYSLTNFSSTFGWQWRSDKGDIFILQPLNVEFVRLYNVSDTFRLELDKNPFLRFSFQTGLVLGSNFSFSRPEIRWRKPNQVSSFRFTYEGSGGLAGLVKNDISFLRNNLFQYVKGEVEFKHQVFHAGGKSSMVYRVVAGAGYMYNDTVSMPFFKQFTGGGPNSMRAWPLRSIGPGTRPLDPQGNRGQFFSRSGDFIFEANAEFRYTIATLVPNTIVLRGALFTDVGNIWNFRNRSNAGNDTVVLKLRHFYRDLSVSAGTGFRFDFVGLFLLRFDFGLRIKNPSFPFVQQNNGWRLPPVSLANFIGSSEANRQWRYENFNFSLGINYPF